MRMKKFNPKIFKDRLNRLSDKLNLNLPKSEVWFWNKYNSLGLSLPSDKKNVVWGYWIYDVKNSDCKYVIEINDRSHRKRSKKIIDIKKRNFAEKNGFLYIEIKAFSNSSFEKAISTLKEYC